MVGGGFKYFFFHHYLGKIPNLTYIFRMGWNHQLVMVGEDRIEIHSTLATLWYWGLWCLHALLADSTAVWIQD